MAKSEAASRRREADTVGGCVQGDMIEDMEGARWGLMIPVVDGFLCREVLSAPDIPPGDRRFSLTRSHSAFLSASTPIRRIWWPATEPRPGRAVGGETDPLLGAGR